MFERIREKYSLKRPTEEGVLTRASEEAVFEAVAEEIDRGIRRQGLWAKAIAEADGSEEMARAIYIRLRAQSLIDERFQRDSARQRAERLKEEKEEAAKRNAPTEFERRSKAERSSDKA